MKFKFFSNDPNGDGFMLWPTEDAARQAAENAFSDEVDAAWEGWDENVTLICWGEIRGIVVETERCPAPEGSEFDEIVKYELMDAARADAERGERE